MKVLSLFFVLIMSLPLFAHEGHGEMPTEPAKYGGTLANVVSEAKMLKKEKNNPALMKAELVRSEDGTVRLYLYDLKLNDLKLTGFSSTAQAEVENKKTKSEDKFSLKAQGDHYIGKMPKQKKRPYNIYITFTKDKEDYFVGFDNLD